MAFFADEERICTDCGAIYKWSAQDQRFAYEKGWLGPKRCPACREIVKQRHRERETRT